MAFSNNNLPFRITKFQFRTITRNHFVPYRNRIHYDQSKWSQCIYFHMVRNGHNVSTSIWYEMVTMYLLPYGTKWSQCIYFHREVYNLQSNIWKKQLSFCTNVCHFLPMCSYVVNNGKRLLYSTLCIYCICNLFVTYV
jgi:hypothetical protein